MSIHDINSLSFKYIDEFNDTNKSKDKGKAKVDTSNWNLSNWHLSDKLIDAMDTNKSSVNNITDLYKVIEDKDATEESIKDVINFMDNINADIYDVRKIISEKYDQTDDSLEIIINYMKNVDGGIYTIKRQDIHKPYIFIYMISKGNYSLPIIKYYLNNYPKLSEEDFDTETKGNFLKDAVLNIILDKNIYKNDTLKYLFDNIRFRQSTYISALQNAMTNSMYNNNLILAKYIMRFIINGDFDITELESKTSQEEEIVNGKKFILNQINIMKENSKKESNVSNTKIDSTNTSNISGIIKKSNVSNVSNVNTIESLI